MTEQSIYQTGKIYRLFVPGLEEICYVGSTTKSLEHRLYYHKDASLRDNQKKCGSTVLFEDGNEVVIGLLEDYPCQNRAELEARERYWIEKFPDCVNKNIPTRGWKERWYANHQHNLAKHKEWIEAHKDQQTEYKKAKREADLETARANDKVSNAQRDKAKRLEWKNKKVTCGACGLLLSRNNFPTHKKNKHEGEEVDYTLVEA